MEKRTKMILWIAGISVGVIAGAGIAYAIRANNKKKKASDEDKLKTTPRTKLYVPAPETIVATKTDSSKAKADALALELSGLRQSKMSVEAKKVRRKSILNKLEALNYEIDIRTGTAVKFSSVSGTDYWFMPKNSCRRQTYRGRPINQFGCYCSRSGWTSPCPS